jgi:hypothetical protein
MTDAAIPIKGLTKRSPELDRSLRGFVAQGSRREVT